MIAKPAVSLMPINNVNVCRKLLGCQLHEKSSMCIVHAQACNHVPTCGFYMSFHVGKNKQAGNATKEETRQLLKAACGSDRRLRDASL